jgi:hypothetical protein
MKPKNRILIFLLTAIISISIQSCVDLRDSDFYPDDEDSRLPRYSEKGYDIAGALLNDNAWRAERKPFSEIMLLDISKKDTAIFEMYGKLIDGEGQGDYVDFYIYQTGINIESFTDLKDLEGKTIVLDGNENYAVLEYTPKNENPNYYLNGIGTLIFKSVRETENVTYNSSGENMFNSHPTYISGTFELNFTNFKVEKGRFDFKLYVKEKQ